VIGSETSSLRSWRVSYLLPYPATTSAVADKKAKGYYRHDQVMLGVSKREVMRELSQLAAIPLSIDQQHPRHPLFRRVSRNYKLQFLQSLAFSIDGGISPGRALESLIEQETGAVRSELNLGLDLLRQGRSFLEAFIAIDIFDETTLAIIEAGIEMGKLPIAINSAIQHLEKTTATQKLIFGAVAATALDLVFAVGSIFGTRYTMIPMLQKQGISGKSEEAKAAFESSLNIASAVNDVMIWLTFALLFGFVFAFYSYVGGNIELRKRVDKLVNKVGIIRNLLLHSALASTTGVMSHLLKGGVTYLDACAIVSRGTRMPTVFEYWDGSRRSVESGDALQRTLAMPPLDRAEQMMVSSHMDSNQLSVAFSRISLQRDELSKKAAKRFGIMAFLISMLYSAISVVVVLYVVYTQNQGLMAGLGG
jgi:general secretion pathway protein F